MLCRRYIRRGLRGVIEVVPLLVRTVLAHEHILRVLGLTPAYQVGEEIGTRSGIEATLGGDGLNEVRRDLGVITGQGF